MEDDDWDEQDEDQERGYEDYYDEDEHYLVKGGEQHKASREIIDEVICALAQKANPIKRRHSLSCFVDNKRHQSFSKCYSKYGVDFEVLSPTHPDTNWPIEKATYPLDCPNNKPQSLWHAGSLFVLLYFMYGKTLFERRRRLDDAIDCAKLIKPSPLRPKPFHIAISAAVEQKADIKRAEIALEHHGTTKSRAYQEPRHIERAKKKQEADRLKALAAIEEAAGKDAAAAASSGSDEQAAARDRISGDSDGLVLSCIAGEDGGVAVVNIINKSSTESPERSNGSYISGVEAEVGSVVVAEPELLI